MDESFEVLSVKAQFPDGGFGPRTNARASPDERSIRYSVSGLTETKVAADTAWKEMEFDVAVAAAVVALLLLPFAVVAGVLVARVCTR
jgi:hypothetical protein